MRILPVWLFLLILPFSLTGQCVFISEYLEGAGNDKCIEIYNGTGAPLDLGTGGYAIQVYANGSATPSSTVPLAGIVAPGDVFVVCNTLASMAGLADQTSGGISHSGNDAVALVNTGGILDVVGQIGVDPGTEWVGTTCGSGTENGRLIRMPTLVCPSFDGSGSFDPDLEWLCDATTNADSLGSHTVAGCALAGLTVSTGCLSGTGIATIDLIANGTTSTQFSLTVSPDPGGLSGNYDYAALPLVLTGFVGDSLTGYSFTVNDASVLCLGTSLADVRFDCPVADQLVYAVVPTGCTDLLQTFSVTVCAIESSSGKTQVDYSAPVSVAALPGASGTLGGTLTQTPFNGCATFALTYNVAETFILQASSPLGTVTTPITISNGCPGVQMLTGMINPCGNESQNEFVTATTGSVPVSVADIELYAIDHLNGVQPNPNYTWSATGTSVGGSTIETCGQIGLQCNRWLDINTPADAASINTIVAALNGQAGCAPNLFAAPTGPNFGTIPPNSSIIFFLGAGGNGGTIPPGLDGLGTNLDFTGFCYLGTVYVVVGEHQNGSVNLGFFANTAPRTYEINTNGSITSSIPYPNPTLGTEPEFVDALGNYSSDPFCTPPSIFGTPILEADDEQVFPSTQVEAADFQAFPNPVQEVLTVRLPVDGPQTIRQKIYSIDGKSTELRTLTIHEGNQFDIHVESLPPALYFLELMTDHGVYRTTFLRH